MRSFADVGCKIWKANYHKIYPKAICKKLILKSFFIQNQATIFVSWFEY